MSNPVKVMTTEEILAWWNNWSRVWEESYEQITLPVTQTLLTWAQVRNGTSILEVACGSGVGSKMCNVQKPASAKLTSVDLSPAMVELAKAKINDPSNIPLTSINVTAANAEELPFEDNAFDRYYASYCLHLTPDPDKMLKEASRVLQKGGLAAFSVWGRKEYCEQFVFMDSVSKTVGISLNLSPKEPKRSPFHLGADEVQLRKRAMDAGFSKCITFYQSHPVPNFDGKSIAQFLLSAPITQKMLSAYPEQKVNELIDAAAKILNEGIDNGKPLSNEALILVAIK